MELANRETNFNKVFTNAPSSNVGVMNPLAYNTKFVSFVKYDLKVVDTRTMTDTLATTA